MLQKHANEAGWDGDGRKAEKENGLITRPSFHIPFFFSPPSSRARSRGVRVTHCEAPLTPLAGPGIIRRALRGQKAGIDERMKARKLPGL